VGPVRVGRPLGIGSAGKAAALGSLGAAPAAGPEFAIAPGGAQGEGKSPPSGTGRGGCPEVCVTREYTDVD